MDNDSQTLIRCHWVEEAGRAVYHGLAEHRAKGGNVCPLNLDYLVEQGTEMVRQSLTAAVMLFSADLEDQ